MIKPVDLVGRARTYYVHGHSTIGIVIVLVNTIGIWFGLVGREIPAFRELFGDSILIFALVFLPVYATTMICFGYWYMSYKGLFKPEQEVIMKKSPWIQLELSLFAQMPKIWDDPETLKEIMEYMTYPKRTKKIQDRIKELENQ